MIPEEKYISVNKFKETLAGLVVEGGSEAVRSAIAKTLSDAVPQFLDDEPSADVQPVKYGKWEQGKCTNCEKSLEDLFEGDFYYDCEELHFCPNCGARMGGDNVYQDRCSNYMDCDGSCFIDDTPCDCGGNIEKCKGR